MTNMNTLAETLAKTGLASSPTEAQRMAESIMGTEKRVSRHFEDANRPTQSEGRKKTYEEEIEELIQKTSPERKNFHIMVSGYKRDNPPEFKEPEAVLRPQVQVKEESSNTMTIEINEVLSVEETRKTQPAEAVKSVYTDIGDERPLKDLLANKEEPEDFIVEQSKEEKKEFKNPIPQVNLMDHFNFS